MELSFLSPLLILGGAGLWYTSRLVLPILSGISLPSFAGFSFWKLFWPAIWLFLFVWLVFFTPVGAGAWSLSNKTATTIGCWMSATADSSDGPRCEAERERETTNARAEHERRLVEAAREAEVEMVRLEMVAPRPAPDYQIINGCDHLLGVESGAYDFVIGEPTVLNCRQVTLMPNQYYDIVLDADRDTPRCSRAYPERHGLDYLDRPGPDRVSNHGGAQITFVVYTHPQGTTDPLGNTC